jgi:hypothetical protein
MRRDLRRRIRRDLAVDRENVLDEVSSDAELEVEKRPLIVRQRVQNSMCATIAGAGSIRDSKALARALRAI